MRNDVKTILTEAIQEVLPDQAVKKALAQEHLQGDVYVAAFGKAAWRMARAAGEVLGGQIRKGVVVTKYGHAEGALPGFEIIEAGHPIPDENSVLGAERVLELLREAGDDSVILLLVSGGGSALLEKPEEGLTLQEIREVTGRLLECGASIQEINVIRKRLSAVKGGKLAKACPDRQIYQIILSDIIDDNLEMIASGPACGDSSTLEDVYRIEERYGLVFQEKVEALLRKETPREVTNVRTVITGSVRELCKAAADAAEGLGYHPYILTTSLDCEAKEAGRFLAAIAREVQQGTGGWQKPCAILAGGETVVTIHGTGKGGRNQELALSAAAGISGLKDTVLFSVGSDGTDGPTDAAGGIVDGDTERRLTEAGISLEEALRDNDSYHALQAADGLILTGPTGTNVNDVAVLLCR